MVDTPNVSEGLASIIRSIEATQQTGLIMVRRDVATFIASLRVLEQAARDLEAHLRWSETARLQTLTMQLGRPHALAAEGGAA
jgi:hypothetical protein